MKKLARAVALKNIFRNDNGKPRQVGENMTEVEIRGQDPLFDITYAGFFF